MTLNDQFKSEDRSSADETRKRNNPGCVEVSSDILFSKMGYVHDVSPLRGFQFGQTTYLFKDGKLILESILPEEVVDYWKAEKGTQAKFLL